MFTLKESTRSLACKFDWSAIPSDQIKSKCNYYTILPPQDGFLSCKNTNTRRKQTPVFVANGTMFLNEWIGARSLIFFEFRELMWTHISVECKKKSFCASCLRSNYILLFSVLLHTCRVCPSTYTIEVSTARNRLLCLKFCSSSISVHFFHNTADSHITHEHFHSAVNTCSHRRTLYMRLYSHIHERMDWTLTESELHEIFGFILCRFARFITASAAATACVVVATVIHVISDAIHAPHILFAYGPLLRTWANGKCVLRSEYQALSRAKQ